MGQYDSLVEIVWEDHLGYCIVPLQSESSHETMALTMFHFHSFIIRKKIIWEMSKWKCVWNITKWKAWKQKDSSKPSEYLSPLGQTTFEYRKYQIMYIHVHLDVVFLGLRKILNCLSNHTKKFHPN